MQFFFQVIFIMLATSNGQRPPKIFCKILPSNWLAGVSLDTMFRLSVKLKQILML